MTVSKDLVAASAVPLVLAILREDESYGYAIIRRVRELSSDELMWTDGMLYPVLHRLERSEWIESTWKVATSGRKRKYYRLREGGLHELERQKRQWGVVHDALATLWRDVARALRAHRGALAAIQGRAWCSI